MTGIHHTHPPPTNLAVLYLKMQNIQNYFQKIIKSSKVKIRKKRKFRKIYKIANNEYKNKMTLYSTIIYHYYIIKIIIDKNYLRPDKIIAKVNT